MNLKLNVKLKAYTKSMIPDVSEFIKEAPKDNKAYARKDGRWVNVPEKPGNVVHEGSGIQIVPIQDNEVLINIRQWEGKEDNLPETLLNDTTYYTYNTKPNYYLNGGTAFSDPYHDDLLDENEPTQYGYIISGGNRDTHPNITLLPIDSKGEYNGN